MDQAAEQVTAADAIKVDHIGHRVLPAGRRLAERWPLPEGAVRPVLVVMQPVVRENVLQVAADDDQEPVEAFPTDAPDPALGVRSRLRRPHRRFDHPDALGAEDLVELMRELAVAITDQEARPDNGVPGVTNNDAFDAFRGSTRLNAASSVRSACVNCGRATWRSSTIS